MTTGRRGVIASWRAHIVVGVTGIPLRRSRCAAPIGRQLLRKLRRRSIQARREAGFTLVEVIVALAILSVGLSVLFAMISSSLQQTAYAERVADAESRAQSLMAEVGADLPMEDRDGQFANGYRWHLKMRPYGDAKEREEWPVGVYLISTEVEWEEGTQRRSYALSTLRLGPRAVRQ